MFIPMGTVVTACMLLAVALALLSRHLPAWLTTALAGVTTAAGAWNVFWHGLRHIGEFWGHMAIASGALMLVLSLLLIKGAKANSSYTAVKSILALLLLPFAIYYAWTIYNL